MGERGVTARGEPCDREPGTQWRCSRCRKLLAIVRGDRLHIRLARGHEFLVGFPATTSCRHCETLNEIQGCAAGTARSGGGGVTAAS